MRFAQVGLYAMLMLLATGCGDRTSPGATAGRPVYAACCFGHVAALR